MIKKTMRYVFLTLSLLLAFIISFTWVTLAVENIPNNTTSGVVIKKEDNTITIQTDNGVKDYNIPNDTRITKNQSESDLNNISPNDRVTIISGNNGGIISIDAVSSNVADWKTTYLPLVALTLVIIGLVLVLWQKKQRGSIKTKTTNFNN